MSELRSIVSAARALRAADEFRPLLLATVVRVSGSSYRRLGARMLIADDRWITGSVSGGCLEGDVIRRAWWCTRDGAPALLSYDSSDDVDREDHDELTWGVGLGCNGVVDLLLEACGVDDPFDPLAFLDSCYTAAKPGAMATVFRTRAVNIPLGARVQIGPDGLVRSAIRPPDVVAALEGRARAVLAGGRSEVYSEASVDALVEAIRPPPHLYVFGAGPDAVPVTTLAAALGWTVTVCDPLAHPRTRARFAAVDELRLDAPEPVAENIGRDGRDNGYAVVMSHDVARDAAIVDALLRSRVRHIAILGPRPRTERLRSAIGARFDARVRAPAGLDLGAETPAEIALAIVAEVQAVASAADVRPLREKPGRIHERTAAPVAASEPAP